MIIARNLLPMFRDTKSESDTATELIKVHPEGFVREVIFKRYDAKPVSHGIIRNIFAANISESCLYLLGNHKSTFINVEIVVLFFT